VARLLFFLGYLLGSRDPLPFHSVLELPPKLPPNYSQLGGNSRPAPLVPMLTDAVASARLTAWRIVAMVT